MLHVHVSVRRLSDADRILWSPEQVTNSPGQFKRTHVHVHVYCLGMSSSYSLAKSLVLTCTSKPKPKCNQTNKKAKCLLV